MFPSNQEDNQILAFQEEKEGQILAFQDNQILAFPNQEDMLVPQQENQTSTFHFNSTFH